MEYDDTIDGDNEMMERDDDDCEPMETERDVILMGTYDESDFELVRDSDVVFMNDDKSEEELSFY